MSKKKHQSETPATQWLRQQRIPFTEHSYDYIAHGGADAATQQLQLPANQVAKTLVMEDEGTQALIVIMRGDSEVSVKNLARQIGKKKVQPCSIESAQRHSGYLVGGTSPFGLRKKMPIFIEESLLNHALIYINGGRRGYLVGVSPRVLTEQLGAQPVNVALAHE